MMKRRLYSNVELIMKKRNKKPDLITVLAILVAFGVVLTMTAQAKSDGQEVTTSVAQSNTLYQNAWSKLQPQTKAF